MNKYEISCKSCKCHPVGLLSQCNIFRSQNKIIFQRNVSANIVFDNNDDLKFCFMRNIFDTM